MDFGTAINTCLKKYVQFQGRATRPEFWYFVLFAFLMHCAAGILDNAFGFGATQPLNALVFVGLFLPQLAAGIRRLHDTDKSGWWQLLVFIPVIGWLALVILWAAQGDANDNRFGSAPQSEAPKAAVA